MVIQTSINDSYQRFQALCDAYLDNPDVMIGLELDGVVGQLKQLVATELKDPAMVSQLFDLRRLIPRRDITAFRGLYEQLRERADGHGLA